MAVEQEKYRRYWNEERETRPREEREQIIIDRLKIQLERASRFPLYQKLWAEHGFRPEMVETLDDFRRKVPVVTKKDLRADQAEHPPFGSYLGVDTEDIMRIQSSSGTTGQATVYAVSRNDWQRQRDICGYGMWTAGIRPDDIVHSAFPFSLFFGGWGVLEGCEAVGAALIPAGGHTSTTRQIDLMQRVGATAFVATPSYALHVGYAIRDSGRSVPTIRTLLCGGEAGASVPAVRQKLREIWGADIRIIDLGAGTTSEVFPFMGNMGCTGAEGGVHVANDEVYYEIASVDDPFTPCEDGVSGGVVATQLYRESMPMIRFWTSDEAVMTHDPCPCGRTYPRLPKGVYGRLDDMLVIRGVNVYPTSIEDVLRKQPEVGDEFRIEVLRKGAMDAVNIKCEHRRWDAATDERERITAGIVRAMRDWIGIGVDVDLVAPGTFEPQTFKAMRVIDRRTAKV